MEKKDRVKVNLNNKFYKSEEDSDIVDFFALLLEIDKRNNPHLYKIEEHD